MPFFSASAGIALRGSAPTIIQGRFECTSAAPQRDVLRHALTDPAQSGTIAPHAMPPTAQPPTDAVTFCWLGVAGVEIAWRGRSLLIDPYFSRLPLRRLLTGHPQPDEARITAAWRHLSGEPAAIAVTHTHIDHALDLPSLARRTPAPIFGTASLQALLAAAALPNRTTICRPGDVHKIPAFGHLSIFAGSHGQFLFGRPPLPGCIAPDGRYPIAAREYRVGEVLVFDLTVGACRAEGSRTSCEGQTGKRFVHIGSAGVPVGALPTGVCDVLFLCVPGWQADENYPAVYLRHLQPRLIVPIHLDRMTLPLEDPRAALPGPFAQRWLDLPGFLKRLEHLAPGVSVQLPVAQRSAT